MTSWYGYGFHITGPLCGEYIGYRLIHMDWSYVFLVPTHDVMFS